MLTQSRSHRRVIEELHKPARRNYPRRKFDIRALDETWQAYLVDMQTYSQMNKGYRYLLTVIDVFSKFAWAIAVKSKSGEDITTAMKSIFVRDKRVPKNLQVDQGSEFYNAKFKLLMQKYKINLYSMYSNLKASIVERFNRTLKTWMWKEFSFQGNYKWLDMLANLMTRYNRKVHRTINMSPRDVNSTNEANVLRKLKLLNELRGRKKPKFKIGDFVRVSKSKHVFAKGYTPNWSTEIFTVVRVAKTNPVTYHLKDYRNEPIAGGFYEQEISKVKYPDVYLIEKVLKRRKNQIYVKWLGFDSSHNSWIER